MKNTFHRLIAGLIAASVLLYGCSSANMLTSAAAHELYDQRYSVGTASDEVNADFDDFTREIFTDAVSTDALTLHFELKDPSAYDIDLDTIDLGRINLQNPIDTFVSDISTDALRQELHDFDYEELTEKQQQTYDILDEFLETEQTYDSKTLFYYPEYLSSTSGTQSLLPVMMSEYAFYSPADVDDYLLLLQDFPDCFNNILDYEQEKADAGLFMSDESADEVIASCQSFIEDPDNNMLIEVFPEKLESVSGLSDSDKADYIKRNDQAVHDYVIPAYQSLIKGMEALKGSGTNENGLCYFDHGKEYYEYLVKSQTGSDKTPEELIEWLDDTLQNTIVQMALLLSSDDSLADKLDEAIDISENDPKIILQTLQSSLKEDFPDAVSSQYTLKYVPESLEDSMNPAFYMIPPVDVTDNNVIYLNNSQITDNLSLFTTLAHEGYPGHLYQQSAFSATNPDPLRQAMNFLGYVEGWATYAENMSYTWTGLDVNLARCLQLNQDITLALYGRIDLGIHYEGWTTDDVTEFLSDYGLDDDETVHSVFRAIVSDPASYLPYCIGYMEFKELRDNTEETMGDDFNLKEFHQCILNIGPCSFDVLEKYIQKDYIGT